MLQTFKKRGWIKYSDFGARGDGKTDDIDAIAAAHAFANQQGLPVKADEGVSYYIGGKERTVAIRTDTNFGTAAFIIDDTEVQNRNAPRFPGQFQPATISAARDKVAEAESGKNRRLPARPLPNYGHRRQRKALHSVWLKRKQWRVADGYIQGG